MTKRKLEHMSGDASMAYGRLAGDVAREILLTIGRENRRRPGGFTKKELADLIGRDKGFVTRVLSGAHNLQLRTVAAMLGAMGYVMDVKVRPVRAPDERRSNHKHLIINEVTNRDYDPIPSQKILTVVSVSA